jgi:hypothetical protein
MYMSARVSSLHVHKHCCFLSSHERLVSTRICTRICLTMQVSIPTVFYQDDIEELLPGVVYHTQPLIQPYPPPQAKAERLIGDPDVPVEAT